MTPAGRTGVEGDAPCASLSEGPSFGLVSRLNSFIIIEEMVHLSFMFQIRFQIQASLPTLWSKESLTGPYIGGGYW